MDISFCQFNCENLKRYLEVDVSLHQYLLAFAPTCERLAIATSRHLLLTDDVRFLEAGDGPNEGAMIETVFEFSEDAGAPTVLRWVTEDVVCCGFSSGDFACFDCDGAGLIEQRCDESPVVSLRVASSRLIPGSNGAPIPCLWILHKSGILAIVPVDNILGGVIDDLVRLRSLNQTTVGDLILLPRVYLLPLSASTVGAPTSASPSAQSKQDAPSHSILMGGMGPCIALYNLGGRPHFEHFGKLAGYYTNKVGGIVSRALSTFSFFGGGSSSASKS
jgi:hypothetical protein